jgi:hypothetical protein
MHRLIIILCTFFCTTLVYTCAEPSPKIKKFPKSVESENLENFSYFPQGFYTFCKKPWKYPLITGPCSPCCALFVSEPNTKHTLGFHIAANNCLKSMTNIIDTHFPSQDTTKCSLMATLFTHTDTELHKNFAFKEGTHKNRFLAIFNMLNSNYHLVDYRLYFNDTVNEDFPRDRWIIYHGPDMKSRRISSFSKGGINFERYDDTIYAERFASINAINKFLKYEANEPLYKTNKHSLDHIKSLNTIHILPLKDGLVMLAFLPNYRHLKMSLILKRLSDSWITPKTSLQIASQLEKFIENNKNQFVSGQSENSITTLFKEEIISYFTKMDDGWVLKTS